MRTLAVVAAITALLGVELMGCATASDVDDGIVPGKRDSSVGSDADEEEDADDEDVGDGASSGDGGTSDVKADASSVDAPKADAGKTDGGTTDARSDGGGTMSCGTASCSGADDLGTVSADSASSPATASGTGNKFFQLKMTEDDSGVFDKDLRAKVTLTSTGGSYEVIVYLGPDGGGQECSAVTGRETAASGGASVPFGWEDTKGLLGHDDSRTVTIEVRSTETTCRGTWDLLVEGNL